ncbi:MAG: alpha-galactosidase, partial [Planctomycetota bacterium]
ALLFLPANLPADRLMEVVKQLPVVSSYIDPPEVDYLIDPQPFVADLKRNAAGTELILENGLVRRVWRVTPNGACVSFQNLMNGQEMLRSVRPEARVRVEGVDHDVGGLIGQPNHAYLTQTWLDEMTADPKALRLTGIETGKPVARFAWGRRRHAEPEATWPPRGVSLRMDYEPPASHDSKARFRVSVHYELYDGVPVCCKWITLHNDGDAEICVERFTGEELAVVEQANWTEFREGVPYPQPDYLHVETDYCFGGMNAANANRHAVHWRTDPLYSSQVNYARQTPCLLVCEPTVGPAQRIAPGEAFKSFRVFELLYASADREHQGLAYRRMYRTIAPWVTENPITHHLLTDDPERAREAIDRAADVGFEAIILSFGSGFNMENRDPAFLATWKAVADYAEQKGIEMGSYSLLSSRDVGSEHMSVMPEGVPATHGRIPSLASTWGQNWLRTIRDFYRETGFDQFENDGPYPGDIDVTPRPPIQYGQEDSRWALWRQNNTLYRGLRADGVYINQPDYHYLNGGNKSTMGYREVNWSLPRAQQVIHTRQNIYDGTWRKTPSMGWMHVPLAEYHGGGAAATIEPLHEHLDHYRRMLLSNLGMGVQAHYRGPRIYDTPETREMVQSVVDWFKQHRTILESDIIHGRRADGRSLDWILHANPKLTTKGLLCVYNPLDEEVTQTLRVNLYYTGLNDTAQVSANGAATVTVKLARDFHVDLPVTVPARGMSWYRIQ